MEDVHNPYAAPLAPVESAAAPDELEKASRGIRLGAAIIDSLLYGLCFVPGYIALAVEEVSPFGVIGNSVSAVLAVVGMVLFGYNLWLLHEQGQTLAKKWLGIHIVRVDGNRATLGRVFGLRMLAPSLIGAIPLLGPLFSLLDALAIFGQDKRCIHDLMADTIVVNA